MKPVLSNPMIAGGVRILLGGIFVYAGAISLQSPEQFADSVAGYRMLPAQLINLVALALPPFEILVGAVLVLGKPRRLGVFCALVLTGIFLIGLSQAIGRGLTIDCGCFGHGTPSRAGMWLSLGRDVVMGVLLVLLYRRERPTAAVTQPAA